MSAATMPARTPQAPGTAPSPAHLRQALRRLQQWPGCPASLQQCQAHPIWRVGLQGLARSIARATPAADITTPLRAPRFDARRAAANDLDRDDD